MTNNIKKLLAAAFLLPAMVLSFAVFAQPTPANAQGFTMGLGDGANAAQGKDQQGAASSLFGDGSGNGGVFKTVTNVLLFLIGAVSVIMLIVGGIRYVVSGGDSTAVSNAKNTILYAVVGIVVAILAFAVVNFVVTSFSGAQG